MTLDYETLRLLSWGLLGLTLLGVALCEGLTLGLTALLPALEPSLTSRQTLIKCLTPTSLGNLAWLVAFIALLFAGWPTAYAAAFASFSPLLLIILLAMLARPLILYFGDDATEPRWRAYTDKALLVSGVLPVALLGLVMGNLLKGIPFHLDSDMRILYMGDLWGLFNPFALLVMAVNLALLTLYGAAYLQLRSEGPLQQQAQALLIRAGIAFVLLFALAGLWLGHLEGYHVNTEIMPGAASNPLVKFVKRGEGLWLDNFEHEPTLWLIPILAFLSAISAVLLSKWSKAYYALLCCVLTVIMVTLTAGLALFPFLLPSNISLNSSLTLWDSSASLLSLKVIFTVTVFALPLMALASRWVFALFSETIPAVPQPAPIEDLLPGVNDA